ncbi:MAG TPA: VWA domain-containing protein [Thermoanaerobaculia bacterium]|nr:VWA domain-containing protein [Thermoanaerobaculia bacterium]
MNLRRAAAIVLLLSAAHVTHAAGGVPWHTVTENAMAVARGQKKLLLVYYRAGARVTPLDAMFESAAADEVFMHSLDAFIPLRLNAPVRPLGEKLAAYGRPLIAVYDPDGTQLGILNRGVPWSEVVEELLQFRGERANILEAMKLRAANKIAEADYLLGATLLNTRSVRPGVLLLESAMQAFRGAGQESSAQAAQILAGSGRYASGQFAIGRKMIMDVIREPANDAVAALAYLKLGKQYEVKSIQSGHREMRDMVRAIEAYRKAYDLAPPDSEMFGAAMHALTRVDERPLPLKGRSDVSLRVVPPLRPTITGDADFFVQSRPGVARVDYYLDDVKVGSVAKVPFRQSIDVGRIPRVRTVKAIAFDAAGTATGEASVTINDRIDAFLVSIVAPAAARIGGEQEVELDVRVPPGRSLARIDVSWNEKPIASLKSAPFRTRMNATAGEFGFLRAVAVLNDGATAEATKLYNAAGVSESVDVGAVMVIASVTDPKGERVGGLQAEDFTIQDEGERVTPVLRSSDDDPVIIGVAIDSSSSMRGRQSYVIRAAMAFLSRALRPQDQAFVVAFDLEPRLVHGRSGNARSLSETVFSLTPAGGTSIFDGVTFALQQFQGIPGKKALLVFSDGLEGTSSASARECERLARMVGVPVYVVVTPGGERHRNALTGIAGDTGGTMFFEEPEETFPSLFDRLAAEMRGQYVLSFTRPAGIKAGTWRTIRVSVRRRDANVRTIQGYRAN